MLNIQKQYSHPLVEGYTDLQRSNGSIERSISYANINTLKTFSATEIYIKGAYSLQMLFCFKELEVSYNVALEQYGLKKIARISNSHHTPPKNGYIPLSLSSVIYCIFKWICTLYLHAKIITNISK